MSRLFIEGVRFFRVLQKGGYYCTHDAQLILVVCCVCILALIAILASLPL